MAEIGIIASVIGIVGAGTKLSIVIFDFAASIGTAGRELQNVATEISGLCSVLKQLQTILEHAHFRASSTAVEEVQRIISQCRLCFTDIGATVASLRGARGDDLFPPVDFVSKVKWTFSKKSKVLVLRSTLEACKSTLSVMLITMLLAERVSQRRQSTEASIAEAEQEKAMTQSLIIAQQCALEQLEHYEDEVEKEDELAMQLPGMNDAATRSHKQERRRSRGRLFQMFSGLSVITDLPTPSPSPQRLPNRRERASVWLDGIVALPDDDVGPHPGKHKHKQKRLSSVGTANAPLQLLRKWTDQTGDLHGTREQKHTVSGAEEAPELWRDSKFSFPGSTPGPDSVVTSTRSEDDTLVAISRAPTDSISPKTARVQSIGFHMVVGVDGALEANATTQVSKSIGDDYEAIAKSILQEHGADGSIHAVQLCVAYGGKMKVLKLTDKPLEVLKHYEELELDPRLFLRRTQMRAP